LGPPGSGPSSTGSPGDAAPSVIPLFSAGEVARRVRELADEISSDHPEGILAIGVLKGSCLFLADLVRNLTVPVEVDFLAISSYEAGTGRVRLVKDLDADISGRHVLLVEDIVDTGLTLTYLLGELERRDAAQVDACAMFDKTARRLLPTRVRYRGFEVPDLFVLGYGLDFAGRYRNLRDVFGGELHVLTADPDAYVGQLYRPRPGRAG
jgi:hypoxanthine phosphoribosyltransferase